MKLRKIILPLLLVFCIQAIFAQKKIVLEKIRVQSFNVPLTTYLQNEEIKKTIASQLNQILLKHLLMPLADTGSLAVELIPNTSTIDLVKPDFTDPDTSRLHLYIDMLEAFPGRFFTSADTYTADPDMKKRAGTVFVLLARIFGSDKKTIFYEKLNVVVSPAETPGMGFLRGKGIQFGDLAITPKSFTEFVKTAANILFDPHNAMELVEMKVLPAFMADNYILPKTIGQPRIFVSTTKNFSAYNYQGKKEIISITEPVYEEIMIKGKKTEKYPDDITKAIKATEHFAGSDFVFLRQECRDVARDKNYLLKLTTQVDPVNMPEGKEFLFTNFLQGNFHYLFFEKDTLARFTIMKNIAEGINRVFPNHISNGFDSSSIFRFPTSFQENWMLAYDYVVNGLIGSHQFSIKCSGARNTIKEIFLDKKLVCIAQGKFSIEKFVVFDASLSTELLNQLFMIGFNRFFE